MNQIVDKQTQIALWRYTIISPLLHDDSQPLGDRLKQIAGQTHYPPPYGVAKKVAASTLRVWVYRYRKENLAGLKDKSRKDKGYSKISELGPLLSERRKLYPNLTLQALLEQLKKDGHYNGVSPTKSCIYRYARLNGLTSKQIGQNSHQVNLFEFKDFGQLWSADFMHGPKLHLGRKRKKTYLHAIIDDATRYIVAANFHLAENTESLISDLSLAFRRFGVCHRFYTDNGSAFKSHHLNFVAARLCFELPHTPPYKPQGRGKIERFFRRVREQFVDPYPKACSLDSLNEDFHKWLHTYHNTVHKSLLMSPLEKKLGAKSVTRSLAAINSFDAYFLMEANKKVRSDGCISLNGTLYEIKDAHVGERNKIFYLPWNKHSIFWGDERKECFQVDTYKNATRYNKPNRGNKKSEDK